MEPKQKAKTNFSTIFRSLAVGVTFIAVTAIGVNASGSALAAAVSEYLGWAASGAAPGNTNPDYPIGRHGLFGRVITGDLSSIMGSGVEFTTQVYGDDFGTNNSATYTTSGAIGASGWSVSRSGADWGARRHTTTTRLELTNDVGGTANVNGWVLASTASSSFSSPYNTTLSSNPGPVTWTFNMRQSQTNPAGFAAGNYGVAFIVAGTSTTNATTGSGYAVVLGQSGTTDPVRLARYSGGIQGTMTNIITSNTAGLTDFGTEFLSVKVVYTPATNTWELFLRNDGGTTFADPAAGTLTSQGTAVDNTSTGTALALMGGWWQGSTAAAQPAYFDNTVVSVETPSPGTLQFSAASYTDLEGNTKSVTVNRVGGSLGAASVNYATGGGTANGGAACTVGVDYITSSGTLNWANGDSAAKSFNVQLCVDGVTDTENVQLTLSSAVGATIAGTNPATLDITDNPPGTLQFFAAASNADENLPSAGVPVTRTGGSGGAASVDYAITGGTATGGAVCTAGVDYITTSGSLNWPGGDAADKFITLQLCTDLVSYEGPETVEFTLSNPQGGAGLGAQTTATLTINDLPAAFFNSTPITINGGPASPYPSDIVVSGVAGPMTDVKVTLFGVSHTFPDDIDVLLVGPGGRKFLVMSDVGDNPNLNNRTFTFSDAAASFMPDAPATAIASGTYKPTNYDAGQQDDNFDAPAPAPPFFSPGPAGTDTFNSVFAGADANGTWSLFVRDAFVGSDNGTINAGWKLEVTTSAPGPGTMEFLPASYTVGEGGSATVTVSRIGGNVGAASVNYATSGGTATGGGACGTGVDFINTSGTFSWADGEFGPKTFNIQTCPDSNTGEPTESAVITLSNPTGIPISGTNPATLSIENNAFGGSIFSNHNPITIPSSGPGTPYPSLITVSGLTGNISNLRLTLNNLNHTYTGDIMMLLVGPQGQKFVPMGNVGSNSGSSNITLKLWDGAPNLMPTAPLANGEYKPTSYYDSGDFTFPAPAGPYSKPAPIGTDTFIGTFGGTDPNGVWSLYVADLADPDLGSIAGGWDLEIATAAPSPGTVEFSSATYNGGEGGSATIIAKRTGGNLGAISVDYATSDGSASGGAACGAGVDFVNASGTLNWADADTADKSFTVQLCSDALTAESTETVSLTLSNPVGTSITGTNPATLNIDNNSFAGSTFSNPAAITIPGQGTASPYPSTIEVSGMTGAITEVRVVLKNFSHTYTSDADFLLVGPGGQKFVLMSDVGSNTAANGLTLSLYDSAAANMTAAALASGSYKPTDIAAAPDSWPSPAPSGPYNSPAPWGGSTFANIFNGSNPNGIWSLYAYDQFSPDSGTVAGGWELQISSADTVRFNPSSYTPAENAGTVSLTVVRPTGSYAAGVDYTLPSAGALYAAVGGPACAPGVDYINTPGTLNFGIGDLSKNIDITLCDDAVFDGLKIILPELSNPTGGMVLGTPSVATVFINDDEPPPTLSISDVTVNEGAGTASFQVNQSFATTSLTQFNYSTSDGTALAGFDYTGATNATGQITPGNLTTTIVVPILADNSFEETETFTVFFTNIVNANPGDPTGVGTIIDDDTAASYIVTTTNDTNDGTCNAAHCSLREAIIASNAAPGVITFAPGVTGTIIFSASRPQITNNVVINGPGADVLAVSGSNVVTVFDIQGAATAVTIRGLTLRNGYNLDFGQGGAITNAGLLTVENTLITASRGNFAGAIQTYGPLNVRSSTLSNNIGGNDGMQPGCSSIGGAIDSSNDVTINITNSTISGNSVATNCSANSGAINLFAGRVVVTGSTITNNTSSNISSAIGGGTASTSIIRNSIIAGNLGSTDADVEGLYTSEGFNIIGNPGAVTAFNQPTDQTGTSGMPLNPMLGALGTNGGTTPTHALLAGSPALDKGKSFGLTTDQRGRPRPLDNPDIANAAGGDGSDTGAVESAVTLLNVTGGPLNFGTVPVGQFSPEQTYTVSGGDLTGNVTVTAPAEFQVSTTSGSGFGNSVTLTPSGGTLGVTTIYVRFAPASGGLKSGDVTNGSPGAATRNVSVFGTGNTPGSVQFTSATYSTSETNADHTFNVTVSRTGGSYGAVDVDYLVGDGTATAADNDYSIAVPNGGLNWADGDTADKQISITIKGDLKFEADETIGIFLTDPEGGVVLGSPSSSVLTIMNDDSQPSIFVDDVTFTGDSLVPNAFTVSLSNPSAQTVTVHYQTADDTAVAGQDYTSASGTLTFNPGETSKDVPVAILPDTVNEPTEKFFLNLDTPINATLADGQGVGTIPNDDPVVNFSIGDVTHNEGNSGTTSYTFTVTRNGSTSQTTSVDWATVDGSATLAGNDYQTAGSTLTFLPADTSKQVTVLVNGDLFVESDEAFTVHLSNPVNATIADADGAGTITNDDNPPNVTYVDDDWTALAMGADPDGAGPALAIGYDAFDTIQEGIDAVTASGTVNVYAGLYRENPTVSKAVTLSGANSGIAGDAVRGAESVIGAAGNTSNVVTINANNIVIDGFTVDGDDPGLTGVPIFSGDDTNASYAFRSGSQNHLQLKNNIVKRVGIGFRGEGDSKDNSIAGNWFDSIGNFDFGYAVTLRNNYYAEVTNNKMTRVWTGVHLNNFSFAGGPPSLTVSGNNIKAYAAGFFSTLRYNAASPLAVSSNQFAPETGAVGNNAGILLAGTQDAVSVAFTGNTIANTDYGFVVTNTFSSNVLDLGPTNTVTGAVKAGVYVTDNLTFNPANTQVVTSPISLPISLKISGMSIVGPGASGVKVENTRAANPIANNVQITGVNVGFFSKALDITGPLTNVTMTGSTIAASATGIAVENAGATPVSLAAHYNRIVADTYAITNPNDQALELENNWWGCNAGPGNTGCGASTGTGQDFDPWIVLGIDASPNPVTPGGNSTITADMTHNSAGLVPSATDFIPQVGASFGATEGSVAPPTGTITSGQAGTVFTSASSNPGTASATVDHQTVATNINVSPPVFSFENLGQEEGDSGSSSFVVRVTKTGATTFNSTVDFQAVAGTAVQGGSCGAGVDYVGTSGTLTFLPSETVKPVTIQVCGDTAYESDDTLTVQLSNPANAVIGVGQGTANVEITNDDGQPAFSISDVTQNEGDAGPTNFTFTVTKTGSTDLTSTVSWFNANGTATSQENDFVPANGELEFGPGDTTRQLTVQVIGETVYEADETFLVELNSAQNAAISDSQGTGTILNDDAAPTIAIDDVTMTEGDSGTKTFTFTITRTGLTAFNGGVDYVVQDGTATAASGDFVGASGNVSFLAANTTKTVSVTVNGDATYETDETFTVHLQNEAGLVVTRRDGLGTITNDDAQPALSIADHTFTGVDSVVVPGFAVTLTGATDLPVTVHYQTADDTAIAGEDYDATSGTLTFNPGGPTVQNIPVAILPDTTQEATEQFFMNLDKPSGATIADGQGVGTIPNDDAPPAFSIDNVTQSESVGGFTTFVFFVTKTGNTALPSSLDYATQPGTATAGAVCGPGVDYETRSGTLNFAAGDTSQMVLVNVCGDATVEGDETFNIQLSNPVNGSITEGGGLGTIQNNTTPAVQFQSATYLEDESQTAVITLVRTGDSSGPSEVTFSTSNGTATGGSCSTLGTDYQSVSTSVTFDPTETTKTVNVPLCTDTLFETTFETVNLALTSSSTVIGDRGTAILNVNDTAAQYKSTAPILIGDGGPANPYPASIVVSGAPSVTGTLRITLFDLTHAHPEDLDILLVAPNGTSLVLMAHAGGSNALTGNGATLTFDDSAGAVLPDSALITTRKYEPTTWGPAAAFPAPAPAGPYAMPGSTVGGSINLNSIFANVHPNGTWQLFIRDQGGPPPFGAGQIAAGWGLQFLAPTEANASIGGRVTTASGNGIRNAIVKLTGGGLTEPRYVATGALGSYLFEGLPVGQTYIVQVSAKRFRFAQPSMVITLQDDATVQDFIANPQE